jgi:hypothetical protein
MRKLALLPAAALAAAALAPASNADGRNPGSVLVYPIHRSGVEWFTVVCVTNKNTAPATPVSLGGTTAIQYDYVNTVPNPDDSQLPLDCFVNDRVETLTPADILCVLTSCHNAATAEGYLVVTAQDPTQFKTAWSFNHLMGSELVVTDQGGIYSINALPFESPLGEGEETDLDGDGKLDFDGAEYEGIPDDLYIDSFVAVTGSSLTLLNMTGGTQFNAVVKFDIWNDNEFPLSATKTFRCWFEEPLWNVNPAFSDSYLYENTPHDDAELDINCDWEGDLETGWAIIRGLSASSSVETIMNPALLGAITDGPYGEEGGSGLINGGRLLWESTDKQFNGDFINFGTDDPEN